MVEAVSSSQWDVATAITFLRDGSVPEEVYWRSLPQAIEETRELNAAISADKLTKITASLIDGTQRELSRQERATLAVRFCEHSVLDSSTGVTVEVVDTRSNEQRSDIVKFLLDVGQVRALRPATAHTLKSLTTTKRDKNIARQEVRKVCLKAKCEGEPAPNVNELPKAVRPGLAARGYRATNDLIKTIGE
jgi:hypothetical protein